MTTTPELTQEYQATVGDLAHKIAGDDEQRFLVVFHALANQVDAFLAGDGPENYRLARALMRRGTSPLTRSAVDTGAQPPADSVFTDPVYLANARALVRDGVRIIGGEPTTDFPECVAVGGKNGWCCSGTLIAPNVVVTAAHCVRSRCAARVFVGVDVHFPDDGEVIGVHDAVSHPVYERTGVNGDIAVLVLDRPAEIPPRRIATAEQLAGARFVRLAGYGNTDVYSRGGYGRRRQVDVPLASADRKYGADPVTEFVAGAPLLDRDSCNGDSGGPAYLQVGNEWCLAGATSRATSSSLRPCGDGGIYTRVDAYEDWIKDLS